MKVIGNKNQPEFPEAFDTRGYGFSLEHHKVLTEDGYILTLFRLVRDEKESIKIIESETILPHIPKPRKSVLIVHGLLASGISWFLSSSPEKTLPSILLDEGYDCWVANLRGATYSKDHSSFPWNSRKYWDFSFHELGVFDVPAMIDYILKTTGEQTLYYVGHSMACAAFFIAMSERPEYCKKVKSMVSLAPAVYIKNLTNKLARMVLPFLNIVTSKSRFFYRRATSELSILDMAKMICPPNKNSEKVAGWMVKIGIPRTGIALRSQIDKCQHIGLAKHFPISTSMKVLSHGTRCYYSGKFQQFDYGRAGNLKKYGQSSPPLYDLTKVDVPILSIGSNADQLCTPKDVSKVVQELPNVIKHYNIGDGTVGEPPMGHGDFILGKDADKVIFEKIVLFFQKSTISS